MQVHTCNIFYSALLHAHVHVGSSSSGIRLSSKRSEIFLYGKIYLHVQFFSFYLHVHEQ